MKYLDIKYTLSVGQILSAEFKTLIYVPAYGHVMLFTVTIFLFIYKQ